MIWLFVLKFKLNIRAIEQIKKDWPVWSLVCTYPKNASLSILKVCNAMDWPGGAAISHQEVQLFHHWHVQCTVGSLWMCTDAETVMDF